MRLRNPSEVIREAQIIDRLSNSHTQTGVLKVLSNTKYWYRVWTLHDLLAAPEVLVFWKEVRIPLSILVDKYHGRNASWDNERGYLVNQDP